MTLGEVLNNIECFLSKLSDKKNEKETINTIIKDIKSLINEEKEITLTKRNDVKKVLINFSLVLLNDPIDDETCVFLSSLSELVYNWNNFTNKDKEIEVLSLFINRTCEVRNKLIQATTVMKNTESRMKDLSNWSPPAFDIAVSYFDKLLEKY